MWLDVTVIGVVLLVVLGAVYLLMVPNEGGGR